MKKFVIAFILGIISISFFSSCNFKEIKERNIAIRDSLARVERENFIKDSLAKLPYKVTEILDSAYKAYPTAFENDIQKEKLGLYTFMELTTNMDLLNEIPFEFVRLYKYDNEKYVVVFHTSRYDNKLVSAGNSIKFYFTIHAITDENTAEKMIEGKKYNLTGEFASEHIKNVDIDVSNYAITVMGVKPIGEVSINMPIKNTKITEIN